MKKFLIIITIILALGALLFAFPILGKDGKNESVYYGAALADEGGGGI